MQMNDTSISWRLLLLASAGLAIGALSACPKDDCQFIADCPSGQVCSAEHKCIDAVEPRDAGPRPDAGPIEFIDGGGGGGGGGSSESEGKGEETARVRRVVTQGPVRMLINDPRPGKTGKALFSEFFDAPSTDKDRIRSLDKNAATIDSRVVLDFEQARDGRCGVDTVSFELGIAPPPADDEVWLSCLTKADGDIEAYYDDNVFQEGVDPSPGASPQLELRLDHPGDTIQDQRRLIAKRGAKTFTSVRLAKSPPDALNASREADSVIPTFTAIGGIFLIGEGLGQNLGDIILVFDLGDQTPTHPPQLVPLQRKDDTKIWDLAEAPFITQTLPLRTEAIRLERAPGTENVLFDVDFRLSGEQQQQPNLMTIEPTEGIVRFFRIESDPVANAQGGNPNLFFNFQVYEDNSDHLVGQAATDKILIEDVDDATAFTGVFYTNALSSRVWRISRDPNDPTNGTGTLAFDNDDPDLFPSGMVGQDATHVWLSFNSVDTQELQLVLLSLLD